MSIQIAAYHAGEFGTGLVGIDFNGELTEDQVAQLPKYVGWKKGAGVYYGLRITLKADKVTGEVNEAGIRRIRKLLDVIGDDYEYKAVASNAHSTLEDFVQTHRI